MKTRYLVRKLQQAEPKSACIAHESSHLAFELAQHEFDYSLMSARRCQYCLVEMCEIGDDDLYHPILSVKLDWL